MERSSSKAAIDAFLGQKKIALAGYSHKPKKFGHVVYNTLKEKGFDVYPVNPSGGTTVEGEKVFSDVTSLPSGVDALLIMTRPEVTPLVLEQAMEKGLQHLWIQQMSGSKVVKEMMEKNALKGIYNRCILLHANPTGIHRFHRRIVQLFGRLP